MAKKLDFVGRRYNRLLVLSFAGLNRHQKRLWLCRCDCGKTTTVIAAHLINKNTQSCGCLKDEKTSVRFTTHGASKTQVATNWHAIIRRCNNHEATHYARYGGRGIQVCDCLRVSPHNLLFVIGDKPTPTHTVERINNDGHYSCGFCQQCQHMGWTKNVIWATRLEQSKNRCNTRLITLNGETKCLSDWARLAGVKPDTFANRVRLGRDPFQPISHVKTRPCAAP